MTNAKFKPKTTAAKTIAKSNLEEAIAGISADTYKRSLSAMSRALDPENGSDQDLCTFSETGRSSTVFRPKLVKDLNVSTGFFKIVAFPRFFDPIAMTDMNEPAPATLVGNRFYSFSPSLTSRMLAPQGKPTAETISLLVSTSQQALPAMVLYGQEAGSRGMLLPEWNGTRWWYHCDPLTAASNIAITLEESVGSLITCQAIVAGVSTSITMSRTGTAPYFHFAGVLPPDTTMFGFMISVGSSADAHTVWRSSLVWVRPTVPDSQYLHYYNSSIAPTVQDAADSFICSGMSLWTNTQGRTWSTEEKSLGIDTPLTIQHPLRIFRTRIHESRQLPEPSSDN